MEKNHQARFDQNNVTILYNVVLSLCQDLALGFHTSFIAFLLEHRIVVDDTLDERPNQKLASEGSTAFV